MWELDHKEGWAPKNWCFRIGILEKTPKSPLDCKEIKPVNSKGNQPWTFIGRADAEAEAPILWPPDAKSWLTGKDSDAWKDLRQKGVAEDEMVTDSMDMSLRKLQEIAKDRGPWCTAAHGTVKSQTWLSKWKMMMNNLYWNAEKHTALKIYQKMASKFH